MINKMFRISSTIVRPSDIALNNNLFGGTLLRWLDEYGALYVYRWLNHKFVTSWIGDTYFVKPAKTGDIIDFYRGDLKFFRSYVQIQLVALVKSDNNREIINTTMKFVPIDPDTGKIVRMNPFLFEREEFEAFVRSKLDVDVNPFEVPGKYGPLQTYKEEFISEIYAKAYGGPSKAISEFQRDFGRILPATLVTKIITKIGEKSNDKDSSD